MSNLRFTVGQKYAFLRTLFERGSDHFFRLYFPWEDKLIENQIIVLTCTEHHKVAWDQDPKGEKQYDGFLFKDQEGNTWANQYPSASYGQLDDSANAHVRRHFETSELLEVDTNGKAVTDEKGDYIRKDLELWKIFESHHDRPFENAKILLDRVYRGIHPRNEKLSLTEAQKKSLQEYLDQLITLVESNIDKKIEFHPIVLKFNDGRPEKVLEDYKEAKFI